MIRRALVSLLILAAAPCFAQNESRLHRDFRVEGDALKACTKFSFGNLTDCGQTLIMGQPMHIAVGSLPPQNRFGVGAPLSSTKTLPPSGATTGTSMLSPPPTDPGAPAHT